MRESEHRLREGQHRGCRARAIPALVDGWWRRRPAACWPSVPGFEAFVRAQDGAGRAEIDR